MGTTDVIIVDLDTWVAEGESRALSFYYLKHLRQGVVIVVGFRPIPTDLLDAVSKLEMVVVDAPLCEWGGRTVCSSADTEYLESITWSLAILHALIEISSVAHVSSVNFPSWRGLAFATLQERTIHGALREASIRIRFDSITAMEAARRGSYLDLGRLVVSDLEHSCLEQCDRMIVANDGVASSIRAFLGFGSAIPIEKFPAPIVAPPIIGASLEVSWYGFVCVGSEAGALRQALRAIAGVLAHLHEFVGEIQVVVEQNVWVDCICAVPIVFRDRFSRVDVSALDPRPSLIVLADTWSAGGQLAMALQGMGHGLIVNGLNPAFDEGLGWSEPNCVKRYDGSSAHLERVLSDAWRWRPKARLIQIACVGRAAQLAFPKPILPIDDPLVTVVVPCYNAGRWLPHTLDNIRRFRYPNLEVIIVDDGSTDADTRELLDTLSRDDSTGWEIIRLGFNQGLSAARNAGVRRARGEYVICVDADDLVSSDFVLLAVRALQADEDFDFVVPRGAYFEEDTVDGDTSNLSVTGAVPLIGNAFFSGLFGNFFSTATSLWRREVWHSTPYDESLRAYEDWQWYREALRAGRRFVVTNEVHFFYRYRSDSMIHEPSMRERHSSLYAEMGARDVMKGRRMTLPLAVLGVQTAPVGIPGDAGGLLLSEISEDLAEMRRVRRSRIVGTAYRLSVALKRLRDCVKPSRH